MIKKNDISTLKTLLKVQPSFINTMRDDEQSTLLMFAVLYNRPSVVQLFIDHGVDVTLCNKDGSNAYHYAYKQSRIIKDIITSR